MTDPLGAIYQGDFTIKESLDPSLYGVGNLSVQNNVIINGTTNGLNETTGSLIIPSGGSSIHGDSIFHGYFTLSSTASFQTVIVDTTLGPFSITGGNSFFVDVGDTITLNSTSDINIGSTASLTNIFSVNTNVSDNIIQINNTPTISQNSGIAMKRYQYSNNSSLGDVINDTPAFLGTTATTGTLTTFELQPSHQTTNDFYNGYWVKIDSGSGSGQVRRIKSYNGTTNVATIYSTVDQTTILNNTIPIEGLDFTTILDNTSEYSLYPCQWVISMWNETNKEYSIVCSNMLNNESDPPISHYVDLHVADITANNINTNSINDVVADVTFTVSLVNNSTTPVELSSMVNNYGVYNVLIRPTTDTNTGCYASFSIGRRDITTCGSVVRLVSVKGNLQEQIHMKWEANKYPELFYRPAPGGGGSRSFTVRIMSI